MDKSIPYEKAERTVEDAGPYEKAERTEDAGPYDKYLRSYGIIGAYFCILLGSCP